MAWIFSLSAECGIHREDAEKFAAHFNGLAVVLSDASRKQCKGGIFRDQEGWWACAVPDGVSRSGINSEQDAREMREISLLLYERLRSAPSYRYALVGVEVDLFREYSEIDQDLVSRPFEGLVISDPIWEKLGSPDIFVPFEPGYHWKPFVAAP